MNEYDLIVIGGGPAGYVAAIRAAQLKMRVAIIEKRKTLGGTCLNIGCIPSKALLDSSERFHIMSQEGRLHGIYFDDLRINIATMMHRKEQVVSRLVRGVSALMKSNKITVIEGAGCVQDSGVVSVGDQRLRAAHILLASGSVPQEIPSCPVDGARIITSTEALSLRETPRRLLVVGGGAIGLELGSVWQRLGSKVTVCELQKEILPLMDQNVGSTLRRLLERQGMQFLCSTTIQSVSVVDGKCRATVRTADKDEQIIECDKVLVAVGRRPYSEGLVAAPEKLATDARGFVEVDERYCTSIENTYAVGDLIRRGPMLAHKAEEEGAAVAELIAGLPGHVNYNAIPNVVYTTPEVATVGKSERELKEEETPYKTGHFSFAGNGRALAMNASAGFARIFADAKSDRVLGAQIVGEHASDLIAEVVILMEFGGCSEDLARTMHAHPTLTEAVREAALDVEKRALHAV